MGIMAQSTMLFFSFLPKVVWSIGTTITVAFDVMVSMTT